MIKNQKHSLSFGIYCKTEIKAIAKGIGCEAYSFVYGYPVTSLKRSEAELILSNWDEYNNSKLDSFKIVTNNNYNLTEVRSN